MSGLFNQQQSIESPIHFNANSVHQDLAHGLCSHAMKPAFKSGFNGIVRLAGVGMLTVFVEL